MDITELNYEKLDSVAQKVLAEYPEGDLLKSLQAYGVMAFVRSSALGLTGVDPSMLEIWNASGSLLGIREEMDYSDYMSIAFAIATSGMGGVDQAIDIGRKEYRNASTACHSCPEGQKAACASLARLDNDIVYVAHTAMEYLLETASDVLEAAGLDSPSWDESMEEKTAALRDAMNFLAHRIFLLGYDIAKERGIEGQIFTHGRGCSSDE